MGSVRAGEFDAGLVERDAGVERLLLQVDQSLASSCSAVLAVCTLRM